MTELKMATKMAEVAEAVNVFLTKEGYNCSVNPDFVKKNGCCKPALIIESENHPAGMIIYFNEGDFDCSLFEVATRLAETYLSQMINKTEAKDLTAKLHDKSFVMENVFLALIEKAKNAEFLAEKNAVYKDFGTDTGLVLAVEIRLGETNNGSRMMMYYPANICQDVLGISPETLFYVAKANTIADAQTINMVELMSQQIGVEIVEIIAGDVIPMYILTNKSKSWGAGSICNFSELSRLREELGANLVIIPSSINEVLIIPHSDDIDSEEYLNLVKMVNGDRSCLPEEDILTDAVFYYDGITVSKMK